MIINNYDNNNRGNCKHYVLPPFYHRDWVFLGLTNTAGCSGGGICESPNGGLRGLSTLEY